MVDFSGHYAKVAIKKKSFEEPKPAAAEPKPAPTQPQKTAPTAEPENSDATQQNANDLKTIQNDVSQLKESNANIKKAFLVKHGYDTLKAALECYDFPTRDEQLKCVELHSNYLGEIKNFIDEI
jgi:hypothetical protein